jgi:hypothetical protein
MYVEIFLTTFFISLSIGYSIAFILTLTRKGSWALKVKPQRMESFSSIVSPDEALQSIVRFAYSSGYKVSNLDELAHRVVLEESISLFSWGFFFPVFISRQADGSTAISVGIRCKFWHYGFVITRRHRKCVKGIKTALANQM